MENTEIVKQLKDAFELKRQCKYKAAMEILYKALAVYPDNTEILLQVAELHALLDNKGSSVKLYEQLLAKNPGDVNIFSRLAQFYVDSKEYDKANLFMTNFILSYPSDKAYEVFFKSLFDMESCNKIVETYRDKNLARVGAPSIDKYYGQALCRLKSYEDAKNILAPLVSALTGDEEVSYYYATALFETGMSQLASKVLVPVLKYTANSKIFNLAGEIELCKENTERAIEYFSQAVRIKHEGRYYYNLASAYSLKGMFDEAKPLFVKAIAAEPEVLEYRYAQAYLYFEEKNYEKATQILSEILAKSPKFREAIVLKAEVLIAENQLFRALKVIEDVNWESPETDEAYLRLLFKIHRGLYRYEPALQAITTLLNIKPSSLDYKYELACLYFDLGQYENAAKVVLQIITANTNYVRAFILAAKIHIKTFDFMSAIRMTDRVLMLDINNTDAYYLKALSLLGMGRCQDAIEQAKTLLGYNPNKAEAYALIGACFCEMKDYEAALNYYHEAVGLDKENSEYFLNIAIIHSYLKNSKEQIRYLYMAHILKPDNKEITLRLVESYINEKQYKMALKLLKKQCERTQENVLRNEIKTQMKEVEELYRKSSALLPFVVWKLFKV